MQNLSVTVENDITLPPRHFSACILSLSLSAQRSDMSLGAIYGAATRTVGGERKGRWDATRLVTNSSPAFGTFFPSSEKKYCIFLFTNINHERSSPPNILILRSCACECLSLCSTRSLHQDRSPPRLSGE